MADLTVATIGVYGASLATFLAALANADVKLLLDVRQRRGVRGREYAWANAVRLQAALRDASIEYRHHLELAPTKELRELQYREDDRLGEASAVARSWRPSIATVMCTRSSTAWTWRNSQRAFRASTLRRCYASSATRRPVTDR